MKFFCRAPNVIDINGVTTQAYTKAFNHLRKHGFLGMFRVEKNGLFVELDMEGMYTIRNNKTLIHTLKFLIHNLHKSLEWPLGSILSFKFKIMRPPRQSLILFAASLVSQMLTCLLLTWMLNLSLIYHGMLTLVRSLSMHSSITGKHMTYCTLFLLSA